MNSNISSIIFLLLIFIIQTVLSFQFKLISLTNKYTYKINHVLKLKRDDNYIEKDKEQDSFDIEFSREVESKLRNKFPGTPASKSSKNNKKSNDDDNDNNNTSFLDRNLLKGISKWEGLSRAVVAGFFVAG